jgi:hypothetical protein
LPPRRGLDAGTCITGSLIELAQRVCQLLPGSRGRSSAGARRRSRLRPSPRSGRRRRRLRMIMSRTGSMGFLVGSIVGVTFLWSCQEQKPPEINVDENLTTASGAELQTRDIKPSPNYDTREADNYLYVGAVSDEDKTKGKAVGDVVIFRYLGKHAGAYRLAIIQESGKQIGIAECAQPCKLTKTTWSDGSVTRGGFNPDAIIGSAFEDAFNGFLVQTSRRNEATTPARTFDSGHIYRRVESRLRQVRH